MMTQQEQELLTIEEAAQRLGKSVQTVRNYISTRRLRPWRKPLDRRVYVNAADVDALKNAPARPVDDGE